MIYLLCQVDWDLCEHVFASKSKEVLEKHLNMLEDKHRKMSHIYKSFNKDLEDKLHHLMGHLCPSPPTDKDRLSAGIIWSEESNRFVNKADVDFNQAMKEYYELKRQVSEELYSEYSRQYSIPLKDMKNIMFYSETNPFIRSNYEIMEVESD